ncbi:MAG: hypothetical protein JRH12_25495 [Deltaproteobacteria bacterium]|jgi:hypothetical protein|nr:hypothetical protein [Deltaproteobacteria bacterium]
MPKAKEKLLISIFHCVLKVGFCGLFTKNGAAGFHPKQANMLQNEWQSFR